MVGEGGVAIHCPHQITSCVLLIISNNSSKSSSLVRHVGSCGATYLLTCVCLSALKGQAVGADICVT